MSDSTSPTTLEEALAALERYGDPKFRAVSVRRGAPDNQFGVKTADIRAIAKSIKTNHDLGLQLWASGNVDAMLLATLVMKPALLSTEDMERMEAPLTYTHVADWLNTNVVKRHPNKEAIRRRWMESSNAMLARAGWSLTTERVVKTPDGLDLVALLDRIEREMADAQPAAQWTMNHCLAEIGIRFAEYRERAVAIGEKLGLYREYRASKGCTSPFAPAWIGAMVARL